MVADAMNTDLMETFLGQVREAHPDREVVMVLDGVSPHRAKGLVLPDNIQLFCLPPYSPELNPTEILWHELREEFYSGHRQAGVYPSLTSGKGPKNVRLGSFFAFSYTNRYGS